MNKKLLALLSIIAFSTGLHAGKEQHKLTERPAKYAALDIALLHLIKIKSAQSRRHGSQYMFRKKYLPEIKQLINQGVQVYEPKALIGLARNLGDKEVITLIQEALIQAATK